MRVILAGVVLLMAGCDIIAAAGSGFDQACIKGRLTAEDADILNAAHPKWADRPAAAGDRVLSGECSSASRSVTQGS